MINNIDSISPPDLNKLIIKESVLVVDVREISEYNAERLEISINIPLGEILRGTYSLPLEGIKSLVAVCRAGVRSRIACDRLIQDRLPVKIINLEGGLLEWKKYGLFLINDKSAEG